MKCQLCPRKCNCDRRENQNDSGYCKMPLLPQVARADLHFWEEPPISGTKGSGTVFFSGCSLSYVYCQNFEVSHRGFGKTVTVERLADIFWELEERGAHNINLVTPTHYVLAIREALSLYRPGIPVVYNGSGYERTESLRLLEGLVDIFLLDFKYMSPVRAERYSKAADYPKAAKSALLEACRQQPVCEFRDGIMQKGVIVRHMLLPQGTRDAIAVFDWVRENLPDAYFSLMSQYIPFGEAAEYPEINRPVTKREYDKVTDYICQSGFEKVFLQERSSAIRAISRNLTCEGYD